jgi:hypothetical protein
MKLMIDLDHVDDQWKESIAVLIRDAVDHEIKKAVREETRHQLQKQQRAIADAIAHRIAKADYLSALSEEDI